MTDPGTPALEAENMTPRILIIDDSKTDRLLIIETLRGRFGNSLEIVESENVEDASRELLSGRSDVVILDMMLPGVSGTDAVRRVRSLDELATIVVVTGSTDSQLEMGSLASGAIAFCSKEKMTESLPGLTLKAWQERIRIDEHYKRIDRRLDAIVNVLEMTSQQAANNSSLLSKASRQIFGEDGDGGVIQQVREIKKKSDSTDANLKRLETLLYRTAVGAIVISATAIAGGVVEILLN